MVVGALVGRAGAVAFNGQPAGARERANNSVHFARTSARSDRAAKLRISRERCTDLARDEVGQTPMPLVAGTGSGFSRATRITRPEGRAQFIQGMPRSCLLDLGRALRVFEYCAVRLRTRLLALLSATSDCLEHGGGAAGRARGELLQFRDDAVLRGEWVVDGSEVDRRSADRMFREVLRRVFRNLSIGPIEWTFPSGSSRACFLVRNAGECGPTASKAQ